jgi:ADP-ribose pyrophosphatase YjhB (NUDIX family)
MNLNFGYSNDLVIFGVDSRRDDNLRSLPRKYLSILLVKRNKTPYKNKWCLPGGFIKNNETSKEATNRVLKKETGLENVYLQQISVNDDVRRDPRGRIISTTYMALIDRTLLKDDLLDEAEWFDIYTKEDKNNIKVTLTNGTEEINFSVLKEEVDKLTNNYEYKVVDKKLAFDHDKILVSSLMELRNKVNDTDIVFHLMPTLFTIGELKQVYELLLGKSLINSVFRRKIAEKIQVTKEYVKTGGHRPSLLCKYKGK